MSFEKKVRALTKKELVNLMLDSIENPVMELNMSTFGQYSPSSGKCYGCAATNTICKLHGSVFPGDQINETYLRAHYLETDRQFLDDFERSIDKIRNGQFRHANILFESIDVSIHFHDDDIIRWFKCQATEFLDEHDKRDNAKNIKNWRKWAKTL